MINGDIVRASAIASRLTHPAPDLIRGLLALLLIATPTHAQSLANSFATRVLQRCAGATETGVATPVRAYFLGGPTNSPRLLSLVSDLPSGLLAVIAGRALPANGQGAQPAMTRNLAATSMIWQRFNEEPQKNRRFV